MKRNTLALVGLLAVLVVVAYLVLQKPGEQSSSSANAGLLFQVDSLAVDRIGIKTRTGRVVLEKKGVEWFLQAPVSYRADQANVASAIHQIKALEGRGVVSSNPDKHSVFQVDSSGTSVSVHEKGAEKTSFVVGKSSSSFDETYLRIGNSKDVVLAEGSIGYAFNRPVKDWRDKTIFAAPRENIREVKFQYGDTTFVLTQDSVWMIGKDSTQAEAVSNLVSTLANVQTDDFYDSMLVRPPKTIAMISCGGSQLQFAFRKETGKYLVQSSTSPQWFVLEQWKANQLLKRKKDLVKPKK